MIVSGECHSSVKLFYVAGNELWLSDCVWRNMPLISEVVLCNRE